MIILALGILIAFVNGANDVSKGIATLAGSGATDYRRAIAWGTAWTAAGALAASVFGGALLATFGHGLLAPGTSPTARTAIATLVGAAAWVAIATSTSLPVSTTHALVGALAGVAALAYGHAGVRWSALASKVALPLCAAPILSLLATAMIARAGRRLGARPRAARLSLNALHWLTSGATSFARGLNDTPKIVAIVLAASALTAAPVGAPASFALVALGMTAGSAFGGQRVTSLLAERVVALDHRDGFFANLVTSALVSVGTAGGLPLSTTHVSAGAIIGTGVGGAATERPARRLELATVRNMLLAWVVTVPAAALLGVLAYWALGKRLIELGTAR